MLESVIKEYMEVTEIVWNITLDYCPNEEDMHKDYGYIDHVSSSCEDRNMQMFDSIDNLERFIFARDSYIRLQNDNDY